MRQILGISFIGCLTPAFAGSVGQGSVSSIQPVWIHLVMLFAMVLVGIASREISRSR